MEPRSWRWIQAAVVLAAAMIGIGVAVWYQNRPVGDGPLPVASNARKAVLHPGRTDDLPVFASAPPRTGTADPVVGDLSGLDSAGSAPPSTPAASGISTSGQRAMVDPMTHLPTPTAVSPPPAVSSPPTVSGSVVDGASLGAPTAAVSQPDSAAAPASVPVTTPETSPTALPPVGTAPPAGGASVP